MCFWFSCLNENVRPEISDMGDDFARKSSAMEMFVGDSDKWKESRRTST
jgi:hypothetical protein